MMLARDFVQAARSLRNSPLFTLAAVATIALGIGASAAIFSVVNAVLLRPLPYANADRLVLVWGDMRARNVVDFPFPPGDVQDLRRGATLFEGFAAVVTARESIVEEDREPEEIRTAGATTNLFQLLGTRVYLGRDFTEADGVPDPQPPPGAAEVPNTPQRPNVSVLSYEFWVRRYGADPKAIGRTIQVGGGRAQIVGVLQPGFEILFPPNTNIERAPDVWTAMRLDFDGASRSNVFLRVIGRMKPGVTHQQAQSQAETIAADLRQRFPIKKTADLHFRVEPMKSDLVAEVRPAIVTIMGAVIFLLLIACANVANLILVRSSLRERELAVRAALGGNRWRLVRQMLAESLVLAGFGAMFGLVLAWIGIDLLMTLKPARLPRIESVAVDPAVLAYAIAASLAAAAIFGIVPALRASRLDVMQVLRAGGRSGNLAAGGHLRSGVVVAEVALSFVLLISCGLMVRSFYALQQADPGYDARNVLTFSVQTRGPAKTRAALVEQLMARLGALPGVQSVSAASPFPLDGESMNGRWGTEEALADPAKFQQANFHVVQPGFFETMRTRVLAGRTFTNADNVPDRKVLVIDKRLADRAFPGQDPIGKRLFSRIRTPEPEQFEIIGVVAHQRHDTLAADGREAIFITDAYMGFGATRRWAIRTVGDPMALASAARVTVSAVDSHLAIAQVQPMLSLVERAQAQTRFALVLLTVFASVAVLLACVGLYGVLSTVVRQRTAEIGVRMALGAEPQSIFKLIVGHGVRLSAIGLAAGAAAALVVSTLLETLLINVKSTDPLTYASMVLLFMLIASAACWFPARRASRLAPTAALRDE